MIVSQVSGSPGGSAQPLQRQELTTPSGEPAVVYRRAVYLRLPTGGMAEGMKLVGETRLRANFARYDYNALTVSDASLRAATSTKEDGVLVRLDAPRRITSITLTPAKSATGQILEIYRLDGDTVAGDPSVSAARYVLAGMIEYHVDAGVHMHGVGTVHGVGSGASAGSGHVAGVLSARSVETGGAEVAGDGLAGVDPTMLMGAPAGGGVPAARAIAAARSTGAGGTAGFTTEEGTLALAAGAGVGFVDSPVLAGQGALIDPTITVPTDPFNVDFTDRQFLLRLRNSTGTPVALGAGDIASIMVRSYPRNARVGLAFPDPAAPGSIDLGTYASVWRANGEIGNGVPVSAGSVDAGAELKAGLERGVQRFASLRADLSPEGDAHLPANLDLAFVFESDAPCVLDPVASAGAPAVRVEYHLTRESLANAEDKAVLRFEPERLGVQAIEVQLPAGAVVRDASVVVDLSLRDARADAMSRGSLATPHGVRVDEARWAAHLVALDEATTVSSIAVAVVGIARESGLMVELRTDASGEPGGRILAGGTVQVERAAGREWWVIGLSQAVVVSTEPHWLVVGASSGEAIWLAEDSGGEVRTLRRESDGRLHPSDRVEDLHPLRALLTNAGEIAATPPFSLRAGDQPVTLSGLAGDKPRIDLTPAALAHVAAVHAANSIPLRFEAAGPGILTVYPPRLAYDLLPG